MIELPKLNSKSTKALRTCLVMADESMLITTRSFAILYGETMHSIVNGKYNNSRRMLNNLTQKGYLEKNKIGPVQYCYVVMYGMDRKEYVPK